MLAKRPVKGAFPESHPAAPSKGRIVPFLLQRALEDQEDKVLFQTTSQMSNQQIKL